MIRDEVLAALASVGPMTMAELTHLLGHHRDSVYKAVRTALARNLVHISDWKTPQAQGSRAPVYAIGNLPSVPEPQPLTQAQRNRRYYRRKQAIISVRRYGERSTFANIWAGLAR